MLSIIGVIISALSLLISGLTYFSTRREVPRADARYVAQTNKLTVVGANLGNRAFTLTWLALGYGRDPKRMIVLKDLTRPDEHSMLEVGRSYSANPISAEELRDLAKAVGVVDGKENQLWISGRLASGRHFSDDVMIDPELLKNISLGEKPSEAFCIGAAIVLGFKPGLHLPTEV